MSHCCRYLWWRLCVQTRGGYSHGDLTLAPSECSSTAPHRDIVLAHSLLIRPHLIAPTSPPDSLSDHRRKWDVRITLDVILRNAPPADTAIIPAGSNVLLLPGAAILTTLHTRSVRLFAPADGPARNPAFLTALSEPFSCARRVDVCSSLGTRLSCLCRGERFVCAYHRCCENRCLLTCTSRRVREKFRFGRIVDINGAR